MMTEIPDNRTIVAWTTAMLIDFRYWAEHGWDCVGDPRMRFTVLYGACLVRLKN